MSRNGAEASDEQSAMPALRIFAWLGLLFLLLPSLIVIPMSFGDTGELVFPPRHWTLHLYKEYFGGREWIDATWLSLRVAVCTTTLSLLLGVPAAYGLVRGGFRSRRWISMLLLSPIMVPAVVLALALYIYFLAIGLQQGMLRLIVALTVISMPFVIVTCMAGLQHVDARLEAAATIMGAGPLTILFRVTLPLLRPSIIGGGLFAFLISFDEVIVAWFVSKTGYMTLPIKMFSSIKWEISPVLAAISTLLTLVSATICLVVARVSARSGQVH